MVPGFLSKYVNCLMTTTRLAWQEWSTLIGRDTLLRLVEPYFDYDAHKGSIIGHKDTAAFRPKAPSRGLRVS